MEFHFLLFLFILTPLSLSPRLAAASMDDCEKLVCGILLKQCCAFYVVAWRGSINLIDGCNN